MKKDIKEKWVKALRSGKYVQGPDYLRDCHNRFCCLGVLCDIIDVEWKSTKSGGYAVCINDESSSTYLPNKILEKIELSTEEQNYLAKLNDMDGFTFNQIADFIENTY